MPEVHVYEPALCCNTGVCGPELDQRLVTFTADLAHVNAAGGQVQRHNLANDPQAFTSNDSVRAFLHLAGSDGLPLTVVDGVTVLTGVYPTRDQLTRYAEVTRPAPQLLPLTSVEGPESQSCSTDDSNGPSTGCC